MLPVPDHGSRDRVVVLVRRTIGEAPGCWEFGMGRERRGNRKGEVSLQVTWGQGGRDRTTQKEGFQLSKREWKGTDRETGKGSKKGGIAPQPYIVNLCTCI
jgi:hypothetical protein